MRNYFVFAGADSRNYGVYISGNGTYNAPVRAYTNIAIPGRDGDLLGIDTRLQNMTLTYPAWIKDSFKTNIESFRTKLLSVIGYGRLVDSYHTDEYRLAVYRGGLETAMEESLCAGQFDLTFECKPQRYLLSGETEVTVADGGTLTNPTLMPARPLIRVVGKGELTVGDVTVTIADNSLTHIDIDCEMMDCFSGSTNCNALVSFSGNDFPVLKAGATTVSYDNTITSCKFTPRWWRV